MKDKNDSLVRDWLLTIGGALILVLFLRSFALQSYKIISGSMENTMLVGDYLLVNKLAYGLQNPLGGYFVRWGQPEYGDIVVFDYPFNPREDYVKRVLGLPGDVMEMRNKQLLRNGCPVVEDYIRHIYPDHILSVDNMPPLTVPEGHIFVLGDNRDNSSDSRIWGTVPLDLLEGKAWRIYWSWDKDNGLRSDRLLSRYR